MEAVGLNGRVALVTGAHGLLGAWLAAALLDEGARVVTVRRDGDVVAAELEGGRRLSRRPSGRPPR